MTVEVAKDSIWRDDDARVRSGQRPPRHVRVRGFSGNQVLVVGVENGRRTRIRRDFFGHKGRWLPAERDEVLGALEERSRTREGAPVVSSGITFSVTQYPARDRLLKAIGELPELFRAAVAEAERMEQEHCIAILDNTFSFRAAANHLRAVFNPPEPRHRRKTR